MLSPNLSIPNLIELAKQAMLERDLLPEFPPEVLQEVFNLLEPELTKLNIKDLRDKLWFSLDNDDTKDLDQVTYSELIDQDNVRIYVAIADVDIFVKKNSPIDLFAQHNTTSVYTPAKVFNMLPERLSYELTSLNENKDRLAIVAQITIAQNGSIKDYILYPALVRNKAKLAYNSVAAWLDEKKPIPFQISQIPGLDEQVKLQDKISQQLNSYHHQQGTLTLDISEVNVKVDQQKILDINVIAKNRAHELIENLMIAANTATARFLYDQNFPSIRRIVRTPKRWDRIVTIAEKYGETLPSEPDAKALDLFLIKRRLLDPAHFSVLSLTIVKLLGRGEYILQMPNEDSMGHFSLAVKNYTHSTAPNRRLVDLINQRLLKALFERQDLPYSIQDLEALARHCTQKEDDANKVERKMKKSATILVLSSKINQVFDALVTGASYKGTWVHIFSPPIEGKLIQGFEQVDVGDRIKVRLVHVDLDKGFIDFIREN